MAIAFANLGASANPDINDPADLASYTNTSWTPPVSDLIYVYVYNRVGTGTPNQPSMSGNSITWTVIGTKVEGLSRVTLFGADASGSTTGVTTVDCGGQTQTSCVAAFASATGVDLTGGVAAAFVQLPSNSSTATSITTILAAISASGNRCISGIFHASDEVTTPSATWTELDDLQGASNSRGFCTQYRNPAETTNASASWVTSSLAIGVASELKEYIAPAPRELRRHIVKSQAVHRASRW